MKQPEKQFRWKRLGAIVSLVLVLVLVSSIAKYLAREEVKDNSGEEKEVSQVVDAFSFGNWVPEQSRSILGTVASSRDTDVTAENTGTVSTILVDIGDSVSTGTVLARYRRDNDVSQISYDNALTDLQAKRLAADSSVKSAEISLRTAENEFEQAKQTEQQKVNELADALFVQTELTKLSIEGVRDFSDRAFGVTEKYHSRPEPLYQLVGRTDTVKKQETEAFTYDLVKGYERHLNTEWIDDREYFRLSPAERQIYISERILGLSFIAKDVIVNIVELIYDTPITYRYSFELRTGLQGEADIYLASIKTEVPALKTKIEALRTAIAQQKTALLTAQNKVENARAQLELARSNGESQVQISQNQLALAQKSQQDLDIRAPFSGKITQKYINAYTRVNPGEKLFSITAQSDRPEVVVYLTVDEYSYFQRAKEQGSIVLPNGQSVAISGNAVSAKLDPATQKMQVKFYPESVSSAELPVGSFVTVMIPVATESNNLIPITAISFEPDGAEVFVIEDGVVIRKKVTTGKVIGDAVEVLDLEPGTELIKYRSRVNVGQKVTISNE